MKQKEITIAGKKVVLAYCFATELIYTRRTGSSFRELINAIFDNYDGKDATNAQIAAAILNVSASIRLNAIMSAILAYYDSKGEVPPVTESDILDEARPSELMDAIGTILTLHNEWYEISAEEVPQKKKGDSEKN